MKTMNKEEFAAADVFGVGAPNDAFAKYFKGNSYLKPLTEAGAVSCLSARRARAGIRNKASLRYRLRRVRLLLFLPR